MSISDLLFSFASKQIFQRNHSNEFDKNAHQPLPFQWFYKWIRFQKRGENQLENWDDPKKDHDL